MIADVYIVQTSRLDGTYAFADERDAREFADLVSLDPTVESVPLLDRDQAAELIRAERGSEA